MSHPTGNLANPAPLGLLGFGMTTISPAVFGALLQGYNPGQSVAAASLWWPSYIALALPGLLAPIVALMLLLWQKRHPGQLWQ